ncbi:MAG: ferrous iron transport protein B [Planctomycetes bacterium]|nr:ferrous iron transport protein B [Planctomycetota bacterium]
MTPPLLALRERQVALVGNPNVGKSTLFNALTGLRQRVANFPGVTVDVREGSSARPDGLLRVFDLPGTYSLRPNAADEAIVAKVLLGPAGDSLDVLVVVLDATNLRRNLYLLSEVVDLGRPFVVALNMADEARRAGVSVPRQRLQDALGVPVVETVASTGEGVEALRAALDGARPATRVWRFADEALELQLSGCAAANPWESLRALDGHEGLREQEVAGRYAWINEVLLGADPEALAALRSRSERVDRYLLHPLLGPLTFLLIMGGLFQAIFSGAGPLMDGIEAGFGWLGAAFEANLGEAFGPLATSLVVDGVIGGVGSVIVFLPQILILFFFIGLLEDTGYMSRAAFLVDRPLRAVGLSGRSFIPLLSSFACAIPGVMATRTISNRFERWLAILVAPLMTCSARLPVYTLLIAAFVPDRSLLPGVGLQGVVMLGLYLSGIASAVFVAFVMSRSRKQRGRLLPLVVELPPYRRPSLLATLLKLRVRGGDFLKRAGTVIFVVSVVLWVLMTFPRQAKPAGMSDAEHQALSLRESYAGRLGHTIEPVVRPLGYDWKIGVGVIASFAAREVFVGTMGVIYSVGDDADEESMDLRQAMQNERDPETGRKVFSLATVFSLLAFYVFALQCGATVAVVKREAKSWAFAIGQLLAFLALAYCAAFVVYQSMCALGFG